MQITVGFSKPSDMTFKWFAWLIMHVYNIPYDHVYIKIHSDSLDRDIIYQASGLAVNFMSPTIFSANNSVVAEFNVEMSNESYKSMMQFAIDNSGKPYGIMNAVGLGLVKACSWLGININNPFGDGSKTWVCDEIVGYILEQFAGDVIPEDLNNLTPLDLYNYMISKKQS